MTFSKNLSSMSSLLMSQSKAFLISVGVVVFPFWHFFLVFSRITCLRLHYLSILVYCLFFLVEPLAYNHCCFKILFWEMPVLLVLMLALSLNCWGGLLLLFCLLVYFVVCWKPDIIYYVKNLQGLSDIMVSYEGKEGFYNPVMFYSLRESVA